LRILKLSIIHSLIGLASLAPLAYASSELELVEYLDVKQVQCLADNIYHEAKGEPDDGKLAVALVTMNRVAAKGFPDTVCGVVYERGQFSWVSAKPRLNRDSSHYKQIYSIAETTYINYRTMVDITKRSLYFHAVHVNPGWNLKRTVQLGRHVFYRKNDVQERGKNVGGRP
jgi:N-acetylmuramoyl-L-alanine amidase